MENRFEGLKPEKSAKNFFWSSREVHFVFSRKNQVSATKNCRSIFSVPSKESNFQVFCVWLFTYESGGRWVQISLAPGDEDTAEETVNKNDVEFGAFSDSVLWVKQINSPWIFLVGIFVGIEIGEGANCRSSQPNVRVTRPSGQNSNPACDEKNGK